MKKAWKTRWFSDPDTPTPPYADTESQHPLRTAAARWIAFVAMAVVPLLLSSCATVDAVSGLKVYNLYTVQNDVELGRNAMKENIAALQKEGVKLNNDPVRMAQLSNVVQRIVAVSDMPQLPYDITLVHTQIVNAAALPGGQMIVFEGLYDPKKGLVRDEDEMAAVVAHEIAHVNCRHSTERLSKMMTAAAIAEVAAAVAEHNEDDDIATAIRLLFAAGTVLMIPMYSRADEYEADRVGMFYMAKAGYDPRAAVRIWNRAVVEAKEKGKGGGGFALNIFNTHPTDEKRFKELSRMVPYAMEEYVRSQGSYPSGYQPPDLATLQMNPFNWRRPEPK